MAPAFEEQYQVVLLDLMGSGLSNTANYTKENTPHWTGMLAMYYL